MGGRFCSLEQTHLACESTLVKITQSVAEIEWTPKKKVLRRKLKWFFAKIRSRIRSFSSDLSALKSRWGTPKSRRGTQNLDGGMLTLDWGTRPPCNLSTAYKAWTNDTYWAKKYSCLVDFWKTINPRKHRVTFFKAFVVGKRYFFPCLNF